MRRLLTIAAVTCVALLTVSASQAGSVGGVPHSDLVTVPGPAHWFAPHAARPGMGAAHWYGPWPLRLVGQASPAGPTPLELFASRPPREPGERRDHADDATRT